MLWLCEPNHGAARCPPFKVGKGKSTKTHPLIYVSGFSFCPGAAIILDIILFSLRSLFLQKWWGRNSSRNFSPGNKKDAALSASSFDTTVRRQSVFLPSCCIHP